jgi:hypothetical protein
MKNPRTGDEAAQDAFYDWRRSADSLAVRKIQCDGEQSATLSVHELSTRQVMT